LQADRVAIIYLESVDSLVFTIRTKEGQKLRFSPATGAEYKRGLDRIH